MLRSGVGLYVLGCSGGIEAAGVGVVFEGRSQGPRVPRDPERDLQKGPNVHLGPGLPDALGRRQECAAGDTADPAPARRDAGDRPSSPNPPREAPLPRPPGRAAGAGGRDAAIWAAAAASPGRAGAPCPLPPLPPPPGHPPALPAPRAPPPALPAAASVRTAGLCGRSRGPGRAEGAGSGGHPPPSADPRTRGAGIFREASALGLGAGRRGGSCPRAGREEIKAGLGSAQPLPLRAAPRPRRAPPPVRILRADPAHVGPTVSNSQGAPNRVLTPCPTACILRPPTFPHRPIAPTPIPRLHPCPGRRDHECHVRH